MARFIAGINRERGNNVTRLGHRCIESYAQGWNSGAVVSCLADDGKDVVNIYATKGSFGGGSLHIGSVIVAGGEAIFVLAKDIQEQVLQRNVRSFHI